MRACLLLLALVLTIGGREAGATDLRSVITDVTITAWNEKDGLPAALIGALAQDREGYLWVGTRLGLLRFDGAHFTKWQPSGNGPLPGDWVRSLFASRDGAIWVGFDGGVVARIDGANLASFTLGTSAARGSVLTLAQDSAGVIWAGGENGLHAYDGSRWVDWGPERGVPESTVYSAFGDRTGVVYVAAGRGIYARQPGRDTFEQLASFGDTFGSFAESPDGRVWFTDPTAGFRPLSESRPDEVPRQGRGVRLVVDRKGNLWIGTGGQGLWRARAPLGPGTVLERATSLTGLLGDGIYALLEDRDGNIWAGTTEGLNRLTPRTFEQVIDLGLVRGVASGREGRVWIRTIDRVYAYDSGSGRPRVEFRIPGSTRAMAASGDALLIGAGGGLLRLADSRPPAAVPLRQLTGAGEVEAILADSHGPKYLITSPGGLLRCDGTELRPVSLPAGVGPVVTAALLDSRGVAWIAFQTGHLWRIERDQPQILPMQGTAPVYRAIHEDEGHRIWLGGDRVLGRYAGRGIATVDSRRLGVQSITSIATDPAGALWLGTPAGLVVLAPDEFDRALADSAAGPLVHTIYTRSDGIAGTPVALAPDSGATRSTDGRLWFATTRGITVVDPHLLQGRTGPPVVSLVQAVADDRPYSPGPDTLALPAGLRKLQIDYTSVNLTTPLKTQFRYRLDPFDRGWVEAGGRRQAFYTNLTPGRYVFRVTATDPLSGTSPREAAVTLTVAPMFYQTPLFAAGTTVSAALLLLGGWRWRERQLRAKFSLLIAERARLGREIHDTLLQGLVAIALQFDSLAHDLADNPRLQARFLRLRDRVEEYIREARRSIWDLHTQPAHRNLVESLRRTGEFATDGRDIAFSLDVQGTPYPCPPAVEEQAVRIAQEATLNSVRHAAPSQLTIRLAYEPASVTVAVADDGRGFEAGRSRVGWQFGITSMHDRARSVGGVLTLVTAPGRGTEVTAVLPTTSAP